jgi:hypothetical protein
MCRPCYASHCIPAYLRSTSAAIPLFVLKSWPGERSVLGIAKNPTLVEKLWLPSRARFFARFDSLLVVGAGQILEGASISELWEMRAKAE